MAKGVVIYTMLTTAFVTLILLPPSTTSYKRNRHIRLFEDTHFDPLFTKFEQKRLDNNVHNNVGYDDNSSLYYYDVMEEEVEKANMVHFRKDGKLNLTLRLTTLFPMIDNLPKDGYVDFNELEAWNIMQAKERLEYSTRKEFEVLDKNNDGLISINEIFPHFSDDEIILEKNNMGHGQTGWWTEQFANADADQDEKLSLEELKERLDWNNDGKLNFQEFRDNAYDTFKTYYQFNSANGYVPSPKLQFFVLDLNKDRLLTIQDLKPIKQFLFPGVLDHALYYATYLMNEV
ncbi:Calcium-dependent protein kinase 16 [Bienertia sinuspersici]